MDTALSLEVPDNPKGDSAELPTELEKAKARITDSESVETVTVRRHEELMDEITQRLA